MTAKLERKAFILRRQRKTARYRPYPNPKFWQEFKRRQASGAAGIARFPVCSQIVH